MKGGKYFHKIVVFAFLMLCLSCQKDLSRDALVISELVNCNHKGRCYVLVIPMDGCGGCRSLAIRYINDTIVHKPSFHYIVSTHNEKLTKIRLGGAMQKQRIIIDTKELFYQKGMLGKYPVLYQLNNGDVLDKKELVASVIQEELYTLH